MGTPDYWGAPVPQLPHNPKAGYFAFPAPPKDLTPRPENMKDGIDVVRQRIMNQHPEEMSAAADQWQNLHDFISGIGDKVRGKSQTLHDETWKSPEAAAEFLKRGPGATLAALDQWKAAAAANRDAMRALVGMVTKARSDMDALWSQFLKDVDYAKYIHHSSFADWLGAGWAFAEALVGYREGLSDYEKQKVNDVLYQYDQQAAVLAFRVAEAYFDIMNHYGVAGQGLGIGPSFKPMNARISFVGHPPVPNFGAPPGTPAPPAAPPRLAAAPPRVPVGSPRVPAPPAAPAAPAALAALAVPPPLGAPAGLRAPNPAGLAAVLGAPGLGSPVGLGQMRQGLEVPTVGGPGGRGVDGLGRGADGLQGLAGLVPPGMLSPSELAAPQGLDIANRWRPEAPGVNSLRDPLAALGQTSEVPASLRSPLASGAGVRPPAGVGSGAEEPPPGRGQGATEQDRLRVWEATPEVEEAFTAPRGGTVPGVLSGPRLGGPGVVGGGLGGGFGEPPALRGGGGGQAPAAAPASRRRRTRPIAPGETGAEWLGLDEALNGVSEPVLEAPSEAVVVEDSVLGLRTPGFEAVTVPASAPARRRADQEAVIVADDEEAWTVPTPGGGVLGGRRATAGEEEMGPTLRGVRG